MNLLKRTAILIVFLLCVQNVSAKWTKQPLNTLAWLQSVFFVDNDTGWIVGSSGTVLTTRDGGSSWLITKKFTSDNIRDVYFSDHENGWLLCEPDAKGKVIESLSYLLRTKDGGNSWKRIDFTNNRDRLTSIFFQQGGRGFGVGEGGIIWSMHGNESEWNKKDLPVRFLMLDGSFSDGLRGTLVGGGGKILYTEDGGLTWTFATLADKANSKFSAVFYADANKGWAVGTEGKIYATENGGKFWRCQKADTDVNLTDVHFRNASQGFAVGDKGTILRTTNAGRAWNRETPLVKHPLESVWFTGQRAFAVGFGGTLLTYIAE